VNVLENFAGTDDVGTVVSERDSADISTHRSHVVRCGDSEPCRGQIEANVDIALALEMWSQEAGSTCEIDEHSVYPRCSRNALCPGLCNPVQEGKWAAEVPPLGGEVLVLSWVVRR